MRVLTSTFICLLPWLATAQTHVHKIAFGSCAFQFGKQQIWGAIDSNRADCWIWLGDNIYGDSKDIEVIRSKYQKLSENQYYRKFNTSLPIFATWDDHDYGWNNSGKNYPIKEDSKLAFLEFFQEPAGSPRWDRPGVYTSYDLGSGDESVKLILLDTRYNRDDPSPDGDVLGPEQWAWLKKELTSSGSTITIIGSSIQFVSDDHGFETWGHFPHARQRMIDLLESTKSVGTLFISGDRHLAELSLEKGTSAGFRLYDFTSSGLTHGIPRWIVNDSEKRVGDFYGKQNFGLIHIDWDDRLLLLEARNKKNEVVLEWTIHFSELGL